MEQWKKRGGKGRSNRCEAGLRLRGAHGQDVHAEDEGQPGFHTAHDSATDAPPHWQGGHCSQSEHTDREARRDTVRDMIILGSRMVSACNYTALDCCGILGSACQ